MTNVHTRIPIQYRCGANYKTPGYLVLEGALSPGQVAMIRSLLDSGDRYVPAQVGMDGVADLAGIALDPQWDSRWQELFLDDRETCATEPPLGVTDEHGGTVGDFIARLQCAAAAGWDGSLDPDDDLPG